MYQSLLLTLARVVGDPSILAQACQEAHTRNAKMHCLSKCTCVLLAAALIATAWGEEAEAAEEGKTSGRGFGDK